ncbi:MAG: PFIG00823557: AC2 (Proteasome assembly chaperone) family [uncultured Rubrobacteraceae bacterium]|uniref:PFIG00823557: AC2 (Proteasome assembly chaperone) family n=1 Tax=uncultured Rubrobacteraceae bacterium TaxID=349277 RepID=A0A6J4QPV3_9ACTN|nr:MAG: PFIG00823557: AC2 (Proteasome assembly chaperone) family [uncultured Rubrobacteraceae bacterium]
MNEYINLERRPELERPILIAGFTGWNDAAEAASLAVSTIGEEFGAQRFGSFDGEEFFDYQATRPQIRLVEGVTRTIEWPENELSAIGPSVAALGGRGAVLLSGPEPNFRWRKFSQGVVDLARELDVRLVVTLGALLADVPHSRPVAVSANAQDPSLVENLKLSASRYEGPTGITGLLHRYCADKGLPAVSFWASVPHYLPSVPSAPAALSLLQNLSSLLGAQFDTSHLERTSEDYQRQVSAAVAQDSDLTAYVGTLEERYDAQVEGGERNLPSGEDLAQELERFLREKGDEE